MPISHARVLVSKLRRWHCAVCSGFSILARPVWSRCRHLSSTEPVPIPLIFSDHRGSQCSDMLLF